VTNLKSNKIFIIAEAGVNHNGSNAIAMKLIDVAAQAGADAVKFQTFKAETLVSKSAQKADYQKKTTDAAESHFEMISKLELDVEAHQLLINYCVEKNIMFLSSPFDLASINMLDQLGLQALKIPSGEITNLPYLRKIGALNKTVIMSTGMASLAEIGAALHVLTQAGTEKQKITILHANTEYPTPMDDVNLLAMQAIADAFDIGVGYSDHTNGIEVAIAAVAMGAEVIEKHFTLDRTLPGPDHQASLEPDELKAMVDAIRNIEKAMGDGIKRPTPSETKNIPIARKSIVARCDIDKGEVFSSENICTKRPGTGISPMLWDEVIGRTASRAFSSDELIEF
jgi:N,N'-diacetyllegionaminate synthase